MKRALACAIVVVLVGVGCASTPPPAPSQTTSATALPTGGVLRVAMDLAGFAEYEPASGVIAAWDPQRSWSTEEFEVARCCLLRTLMSYNGKPVAEGGAELRPDLAADYPEVSADGLTWRFQLKPDIHYAPPMADRTVTSADFVRALERTLRRDPFPGEDPEATIGPYGFYFAQAIVGAEEFTTGKASAISGLETPDPLTLVVHLIKPTGDLGVRLAMPAAAPIPPGAADGHDADYALHQIASGPYMIEGSDQLQPALPAAEQAPVSGYLPAERLTLVRNPSWTRATDALRSALADRIEIVNGGENVIDAIVEGSLDVALAESLDSEEIDRFRADPQLSARVHAFPALATEWITMNVAAAPFDDIHVRRAIQLVVDKVGLIEILGRTAEVQSHAIPDAFENGLLADYDPYPTSGHRGSIDAAKAEMAQSRYDSDRDGVCDDASCADVFVPIEGDDTLNEAAASFARAAAQLGLTLRLEPAVDAPPFVAATDPANHVAMLFTVTWFSDYLNGASWLEPLARSDAIGNANVSLIGASDAELKSWGYTATGVPNIDAKIGSCVALTGADQFACWAETDQYLMERVAAWVPIGTRQSARLTSSRVATFQFDASLGTPSLGQIELGPS